MHKACDLELRLSPTSNSYDSQNLQQQENQESQKITIFYNGQMCFSSDVTHLQAKSIISIASKEKSSLNGSDPPNMLWTQSVHQLQNPKVSMKRSLRSFLQKRKIRIQATSPYPLHLQR
ncbi:unnamed protein product [Cochlearia groenlandica]